MSKRVTIDTSVLLHWARRANPIELSAVIAMLSEILKQRDALAGETLEKLKTAVQLPLPFGAPAEQEKEA